MPLTLLSPFPRRQNPRGCGAHPWVGTGYPQLGLLWSSTLLAAMRTTGHLALSRAHFGPGRCHQAGSCSVGGLLGPLAEGAAHSCGLPVLWKQKGWHKDLSPVTSWAWQGIGCLHLHCLGRASESQPLVPHRGQFREGQAWRGSTTASGLLSELARPLCCRLWLSQVSCHPGETPGVTLDSRGVGHPKLTSSLS